MKAVLYVMSLEEMHAVYQPLKVTSDAEQKRISHTDSSLGNVKLA